jgi:pyruvate/2-oxoglutarate dehydrogenase complex dihydrolipoamide acyltransferase (E2) component
MRQFLLPDLGEGLEEAEIVAWHVTEGDHVVSDQPLVSVETDKAVVEVPSPRSGRISHLFGAKGWRGHEPENVAARSPNRSIQQSVVPSTRWSDAASHARGELAG